MMRLISKLGSRWAIALAMTLLAALQIAYLPALPFIERLDVLAYDTRMRVQKGELDPRVVIVDIDEKSIAEVGRWPWSRNVVAKLVDTLSIFLLFALIQKIENPIFGLNEVDSYHLLYLKRLYGFIVDFGEDVSDPRRNGCRLNVFDDGHGFASRRDCAN